VERTFVSSQDLLPQGVKNVPLVVVGAGGIGSFLVLSLAKMGFTSITVYDADTIEEHNVDNQLYGPKHLGMTKVAALAEVCMELSGVEITPKNEWFKGSEPFPHRAILLLAVDSITARNDIWKAFNTVNSSNNANIDICKYFIDARMGAEIIRVFSINPDIVKEREFYEASLHPESESHVAPCTAKSIMYTSFACAAFVSSILKRFLVGSQMPQESQYSFFNHTSKEVYLVQPKTQTLDLETPLGFFGNFDAASEAGADDGAESPF